MAILSFRVQKWILQFLILFIFYLVPHKAISEELIIDCKNIKYKISNKKIFYEYAKDWIEFKEERSFIIFNKKNVKIISKLNTSYIIVINKKNIRRQYYGYLIISG